MYVTSHSLENQQKAIVGIRFTLNSWATIFNCAEQLPVLVASDTGKDSAHDLIPPSVQHSRINGQTCQR